VVSVVDTNVLVHSAASGSPEHHRARTALARLTSRGPVAITRQVLREYLAATTRPQSWSRPLTLAEATSDTDAFIRRFGVLEDGPPVWSELIALSRKFRFGGRQVYDANIVATMLAHGETRLLTFNDADFRRFAGLIEVVVP
jgi:predicted nucleic acid-binding protein